jgi:DNA-binding LacI/PurR family transcriptional regulator
MSNTSGGSGKRRITLTDIARAAGVSSMTVSLSLRNHPKISEKTRMRVQKKAEELGYSPDPMLSALSNYRHTKQPKTTQAALAWINPFRDPKRQHSLNEFELYWKGAAKAAEQYGYRLEEFVTTETSLQRMDTIFKTRNIKGILIALLCARKYSDTQAEWHAFPWQDYAAVRFGRSRAYPESHFASSAQARNTEIAFEQIYARGYRRVGFAGLHTRMRVFCMGAYFAQVDLPSKQQVSPLLFTLKHTPEKRLKMLDQWLQKEQPDAIFTDTAELPQMLKELGVNVPADVGLATTSIYDTPINAGIDQNPEEIGRAAVRTLISLINEQNYGIPSVRNEILIEGNWVDGDMLPTRV